MRALVWQDAEDSAVDEIAHVERFEQYLLRAVIFRLVSDQLVRDGHACPFYDPDPFARAASLALAAA